MFSFFKYLIIELLHDLIKYKMQFDAALLKFFIRLDQLRRHKGWILKIDQTFPQISENGFWRSSTDLKLLQCHSLYIHFQTYRKGVICP